MHSFANFAISGPNVGSKTAPGLLAVAAEVAHEQRRGEEVFDASQLDDGTHAFMTWGAFGWMSKAQGGPGRLPPPTPLPKLLQTILKSSQQSAKGYTNAYGWATSMLVRWIWEVSAEQSYLDA